MPDSTLMILLYRIEKRRKFGKSDTLVPLTPFIYRSGMDDEFPGLEIVKTLLGDCLHRLLRDLEKNDVQISFKFVKKI